MARRKLTRRNFLASSAVLGAAAGCTTIDPPFPGSANARVVGAPLAQSFSIAARIPSDGNHYYIHDPGMALLPSGDIFVAAPCWQVASFGAVGAESVQLFLSVSSDGGQTWDALPTIPNLSDGAPFVHDGDLYMFVQSAQFGALMIMKSADEGHTWTSPVTLFDQTLAFWNCSTPMVEQNGKLYWAVQQGPGFQGDAYVIAADTTKDLLDPTAWQHSTPAKRPATPTLVAPSGAASANDAWLEPNIISISGKIRVFLRTNLDDYATASLPIVCDLTEDANGLHLDVAQFYPMPGGQNKTFILQDTASSTGLYWMLSNLPADSQAQVLDWKTIEATNRFLPGPGNDRRFLMLSYSMDALNWFPAGCVARARLMRQSFMYPSAAIDGDDLILISRTSINGETQHNADTVTFHRVTGFRSLALNLYPDSLSG